MSMTHSLKMLLVGFVVVAALVCGFFGYQWYDGKYGAGANVFSTVPVTLPSGTSTTDDSLAKDAAAIDAQLKGLDADSASADASIKESAQVQ